MAHGKKDPDEPLTPIEERFCTVYFEDLKRGSKQRAAIAAGASPKNARHQASRWLRRANIQRRLEELRREQEVASRITVGRILAQYELFAFGDTKDMYDEDGNLLTIPKMPAPMRQLLAGFDVEDRVDMSSGEPEVYTVKKVRLVDRKGALDSLAKWRDIFPPVKRENTLKGTGPGGAIALDATIKPVINLTVLPANFHFPETKE